MNLKLILIGSIALLISIFINITLAFNLSNQSHKYHNVVKQNEFLEKKINTQRSSLSVDKKYTSDKGLTDIQGPKELVKEFFTTQYEYSSDNYKDRFKKIKKYVSNEVYGQLTAAGDPDIPKIKFQNKIRDLKVYLSNEANQITGLVLLKTVYEVEGVKSPEMTQIFQVKISEEQGRQLIVGLKALGTFTAMTES